jgi:hypothetical protein
MHKLLDVLLHVPAVFKLSRDTFLQVTDAISADESPEDAAVLVHGLLLPSANVRNAVLQALEPFDLEEIKTPEILYLALYDSDERNAELASALYAVNGIALDKDALSRLFSFLEHETPYVRNTTAKALSQAIPSITDSFDYYLTQIFALYDEKVNPPVTEANRKGETYPSQV